MCFQVKPILLSVLLDKQEPEPVRAAAFIVVKDSHPSFTTLQLIAHSLRTEPSRQIKTLIYSSLVNLAKLKSDITEIRTTYVLSSLPLSAVLYNVADKYK